MWRMPGTYFKRKEEKKPTFKRALKSLKDGSESDVFAKPWHKPEPIFGNT